VEAEELVNKSLVKHWAVWALVWLTVFPLVGLIVSIKFHNPDFLGGISWLTFGRMRPVHVNGVIFGAFSTSFIALVYYYVPQLCGVRLYKEKFRRCRPNYLFFLNTPVSGNGTAYFRSGFSLFLTGLSSGEFIIRSGTGTPDKVSYTFN
jgi:cbb3-type cytochrome oxidase subunit 1